MKYLPLMISLFLISVAANGGTETRASCAEILLQVGAGRFRCPFPLHLPRFKARLRALLLYLPVSCCLLSPHLLYAFRSVAPRLLVPIRVLPRLRH